MSIRVMSVFGTRPEAVKMAPLIKKMQAENTIENIVCVSGQHRDMLDQVLETFDLHPDYDLNIMTAGQTLTDVTTKILIGLNKVIENAKPNIILVHGDTSTAFSSALAGFYAKVPVGHVEAGLRTFSKYEPFPEEVNRTLIGDIASLHFAPTQLSKEHLINQNIKENIFVTGNTAIDALKLTIKNNYKFLNEELGSINYNKKKVIVLTAHRRENWGKPLENICDAINKITNLDDNVIVIYAIHKNPIVYDVAKEKLGNNSQVHLIEPLSLVDMHNLLSKCYMVLTDSGGLQEEVPYLGKPVLVLRNVTERPEGITAGTLKLVGTNKDVIVDETMKLLTDKQKYEQMAQARNPFGDGRASERIVEAIKFYFGYDNKVEEFL
ncbi:UDP-N-acetylglucosamine 2-epimerase [Candidatus Epulonipiscium fishelsonii]|uniref:UDP-N-acetylglucosamine 2-epimerase n=1 Tax=Candidatus Epulonipiscium fishelsonii TaxID=77094 RepID=A0ACC8XEJ1_9FIRM|nr:UDP-N-acetylglucosamine 2-epimerase [Epulopiscium sp. SCG-B11WGA-EpuloA1]ONI43932.1 UDP-N-acetylglucosamine 2-epimerase [Epulopiscium sp. SCG-B05WGA-EpuloA1]